MKNHVEEANKIFAEGYNCAQAVFAAFCDETGMSMDAALRLASPFGGGMGLMREVCGAVSGMSMVAGLKFGYADLSDGAAKIEHYQLIQSLAKEFERKHGSIICRDLLELGPGASDPVPKEGAPKYKHDPRCVRFVACAAEMLEALLRRKGGAKIAVACEGASVSEHFGHCGSFQIFEERDGTIVGSETKVNPGHQSGSLPGYLDDLGVQIVIAGGMGDGAVDGLHERGVAVITGAQGNAREVVEAYLKGELQSTSSVCHRQQHHGECGHEDGHGCGHGNGKESGSGHGCGHGDGHNNGCGNGH
ncbi:MAG: C-GCAxxG-C-C family (seleno)protein [Bacillota bacterium]